MSIGIYTGGTTGGTDGTLEVPGDTSGITLGAVGTIANFHMRCPSGYQNAQQLVVNAPTDCEVSADGLTFASTATYAQGAVQDTNALCVVRRASGTTALTTGLTTTPRLPSVTTELKPDVTKPVLSGTLTATAGDTQATLAGPTASDDRGIAKWQYRIGSGAWVDIANSANTTMPSTAVTGLTNGTEYSFTVRALDAAGNASDASNAAIATPTASWTTLWSDDFEDNNLTDWTNQNTAWATGAPGLHSSNYAAKSTATTNSYLYRAFTAKAHVRATFRAKSGADLSAGKRYGTFVVAVQSAPGTTSAAVVALKDGNVQVNHGGTYTSLVAMDANTEYLIVVEFNAANDDKYTVTVNGTLYDNSGNGYRVNASSSISTVESFGVSPTANGGTTTVDDVTIEWS